MGLGTVPRGPVCVQEALAFCRRRQGGCWCWCSCDKLRPLLALAKADVTPTSPFVRTPSRLLRGACHLDPEPHAGQSLLPRPAVPAPCRAPALRSARGSPGLSWIHSHPRQTGLPICQTGTFSGSSGLTAATLCLLPGGKRANRSRQAGESRCSQDLLQVGPGVLPHSTPPQL